MHFREGEQYVIQPFFKERLDYRRNFLCNLAAQNEKIPRWEYVTGDYRNLQLVKAFHEFGPGFPDFNHKPTEELEGGEFFFASYIERLLDQKGISLSKPVVCLDIGGMLAITWSKLAAAFKDDIHEGHLVFVVSNLFFRPQDDSRIRREFMREHTGLNDTLEEARDLVHFVNGNVSALRKQAVKLPTGESLPLKNNVDFIHDRFAVNYWSLIPEVELPQVASLLSETGSYHIQEGDIRMGRIDDFIIPPNEDATTGKFQRNLARLNGRHQALTLLKTRLGMQATTTVETGDLTGFDLNRNVFYKKPGAPKIAVNR